MGFSYLSAIGLIILPVSEWISPSAEGDKVAPPHRGHSVKNINQQKKPVKQKENCIL